VEFSATRTFGQQFGSDSANASWAVGAAYSGGPVALAAYVQQMKNLAGSETRKIWGLGGNYRINDTFHLFGGFMKRTHEVSPQLNKAFLVGANVAAASAVGKRVAEKARAAGIEQVAFDRAGFRYHGRVKALAEAAREAGLKF